MTGLSGLGAESGAGKERADVSPNVVLDVVSREVEICLRALDRVVDVVELLCEIFRFASLLSRIKYLNVLKGSNANRDCPNFHSSPDHSARFV